MKQIVVVTNERSKHEAEFAGKGFYVTWCRLEMNDIMNVRDRSNVFLFCLADEDPDLLKVIGMYMRDLCIDDEKILYLYGNSESIRILSKMVPAIFVQKTLFGYAGTLASMLDDMAYLDEIENRNKPALLIIDDDYSLIEQLRGLLSERFEIYVSHYDLRESSVFLFYSDVVLMGTKARYSIPDVIDFFRVILKRKNSAGLHLYYLASDDTELARLNVGSDKQGIAFSKTRNLSIIADYLARLIISQ